MVQPVQPRVASGVYQRHLGGLSATEGLAEPVVQKTGTATRTRRADSVSMSEKAQLLARALQAARGSSDVREGLVAELRAAVQSGEYRVDADALARSIASAAGAGDDAA